jgi:signal transduction histidine kinase/ligand-binding sensor domain-containing protein
VLNVNVNWPRWLWFASALLLLAPTAPGTTTNSHWFHRSWSSQDGLPDNTVTGIAQTPDGFLWTATPNGLARFDGVRFQEMATSSAMDATRSRMEVLLLDRQGRLWAAQNSGLITCLDGSQITTFTNNLPRIRVKVMAEDGEGAIWINYADGQLIRIRELRSQFFTSQDGWSEGSRSWVAKDLRGQLWFFKNGTIGVFRHGKFVPLHNLRMETYCLTAARKGGIWISGRRELWQCSETDGLKLIGPLPAFWPSATTTAVLEDQTGAVWIGTAEAGLIRYDTNGFTNVKTSHREILSLAEDQEGNIWIGTRLGGLSRLRERALELENVLPGLPAEAVLSVCQDKMGDIWATTQSGLVAQRREDHWNNLSASTNWFARYANCIAPAADGGVWIGTQRRGLIQWRQGTNTANYRAESGQKSDFVRSLLANPKGELQSGLSSDFVRSLQASPNGDLWIGFDATNALQRLRAGKLDTFQLPNRESIVSAMTLDTATNLWVGTGDGLLLRIAGEQLVDETAKILPGLRAIRCLLATADGSLWIGSAGRGVGRLKEGKFTLFSQEQGLRDDHISQILADDVGRLWFLGDRGLFYVKQDDFDAVTKGTRDQLQSATYDREEGLTPLLGSHGQWPGAIRSQDGRLWFPTQSGVTVLAPDRAKENPQPPPVAIMRVVTDGSVAAAYDGGLFQVTTNSTTLLDLRQPKVTVPVPPGNQQTVFEFTALSFTAPGNLAFKYKLEGLDRDWVETRARRTEIYRQIPPGEYRFRVNACNNDGIWNETGVALTVRVVPYFWQTWWFRIAAVIVILGLNGGAARYFALRRMKSKIEQLNRERAVENERSRIAQDIHDDIGANLTEITLLSELAQSEDAPPDEVKADIRKIATRARELTRSVDATVWAVNPRYDNFDSFVSYACTFAEDYLASAAIRLRLEVPTELPRHALAPNVRHHVFLILKEALNNIVKHAAASEVWLRIKIMPDGFRVVIQDDGKGFDLTAADARARKEAAPLNVSDTQKDGLFNMRKRMESIGGQFELSTQPDNGTTITLHVDFRGR